MDINRKQDLGLDRNKGATTVDPLPLHFLPQDPFSAQIGGGGPQPDS